MKRSFSRAQSGISASVKRGHRVVRHASFSFLVITYPWSVRDESRYTNKSDSVALSHSSFLRLSTYVTSPIHYYCFSTTQSASTWRKIGLCLNMRYAIYRGVSPSVPVTKTIRSQSPSNVLPRRSYCPYQTIDVFERLPYTSRSRSTYTRLPFDALQPVC